VAIFQTFHPSRSADCETRSAGLVHASTDACVHRSGTYAAHPTVLDMAQAESKRRPRFEYCFDRTLPGQRLLGARFFQQEREAPECAQTRAYVAWGHLSVPMAFGHGDVACRRSHSLRNRLQLLGLPGHWTALDEHVLLAHIPAQRLPRRQDVQTEKGCLLRSHRRRLCLLLRQSAARESTNENGRLLRHHVSRKHVAGGRLADWRSPQRALVSRAGHCRHVPLLFRWHHLSWPLLPLLPRQEAQLRFIFIGLRHQQQPTRTIHLRHTLGQLHGSRFRPQRCSQKRQRCKLF